ncbi:MAG: aldolase/citrate lyase family protein [Pseudomonadota bacterium]
MIAFPREVRPVLGTWVSIPHPSVIEVLAGSGFDFLLFDGEHAPLPTDALATLLPAAELGGKAVCYRVPINRPEYIKAALDAGVGAVMVPMVETADAARAVVSAARYPPLGNRGVGPWRGSDFYRDMDTYLSEANDRHAVVVQIESRRAVAVVEEIAAVDGTDVLYVGPADLASDLHARGEGEMLDAAIDRVAEAAARHGKRAGIDVASVDDVPDFVRRGFSFFTYGLDLSSLDAGTAAAFDALSTAAGCGE